MMALPDESQTRQSQVDRPRFVRTTSNINGLPWSGTDLVHDWASASAASARGHDRREPARTATAT